MAFPRLHGDEAVGQALPPPRLGEGGVALGARNVARKVCGEKVGIGSAETLA